MPDIKGPLQIINLRAENVKRIQAVNITPKDNMVLITGRNGQGKTSVLDTIWWTIAGMANVQSEPIRKGAESALMRLDLGEVIVTRTFGRGKGEKNAGKLTTDITVETRDGARWPSPQKLLDSIMGPLSMDPLDFMRMNPKKRFDTVRSFVSGVDFEAMAKDDLEDRQKRTAVNRRVDELKGQVAGIQVPAIIPSAKMDEAAIVQEIADVGQFNGTLELRKERRIQAEREMNEMIADAQYKRDQAATLIQEAAEREEKARQLQDNLNNAEALPEPKDAAALQTKLQEAKATNALFDQMQHRTTLQSSLTTIEAESAALTAKITKREEDKRKSIAAAKMPVEGLDFGTDDILFNGVPFEQASDADQLRVSLGIAMANNPTLRVIRVRDGSLLDDDALKIVAEMAADKGYQVWMEKVDSSGKIGFVIEDGTVKAVNDSAPAEGGLL